MPFFCILKSRSNMQQLFFMSYTYTRPYAPTGAMRIDDDDDDDTLIV